MNKDNLEKIKKQLKLLLKRVKLLLKDKKIRYAVICVAAVLFALIVTAMLNTNSSDRTVLFSSESPQEVADMYTTLKTAGADPQIDSSGRITVPSNEVNVWAFYIGSEGYASLGYGLAAENSGMTQTEAERQTWDLRQSQDRLQDTLKMLSGVSNAVVTLDIPQTSNYIWEQTGNNQTATASILLTLTSNSTLSPDQVASIKNFVAAQFNNMSPENVTVLNSKTMLEMESTSSSNVITYEQNFELERIIQSQIENNIVRLLSARYGADGVVATAKVTINYDKMITEQLELAKDPEDGEGFITDKTIEGIVSGYNNVAGIVGEEDNTDTPTYPYGTYEAEDAVHFYSTAEFDYSYTKTQVEKGQAALERATVSVMVKDSSFTEAVRTELVSLISTSADIAPELIFVSSFVTPSLLGDGDTAADNIARFFAILDTIPAWVFITIGVSLLLIILLIVSAVRKHRKKKNELKIVADEAALAAQREIEDHKQKLINDANASTDHAGDAIINEIRGFAEQNPEITASLIRTWLKEETN